MSVAVEVDVLINYTIGKVGSYSAVAMGMIAYLVRQSKNASYVSKPCLQIPA